MKFCVLQKLSLIFPIFLQATLANNGSTTVESTSSGMSTMMELDKHKLLEKFNNLRREVAKEYGIVDMKELVWDDRLSKLASPAPSNQCDMPPNKFCRYFLDGQHGNTVKFTKKRIAEFLPFIASGDLIGAELIMKNYPTPHFASLEMIVPTQTSIDCFLNTCHEMNSAFYDIAAIGEKEMMLYYDVMCLVGPQSDFRMSDFVSRNATKPKKLDKNLEEKMKINQKPLEDLGATTVSKFSVLSAFFTIFIRFFLLNE